MIEPSFLLVNSTFFKSNLQHTNNLGCTVNSKIPATYITISTTDLF